MEPDRTGSRIRHLMLSSAIGVLVVTAVLFALPLSAESNEAISGSALLLVWLTLVAAHVLAARRTAGIDRFVWIAFLVTDVVLFVLFTIDSGTDTYLPTREALPIAFLLGPVGALEGVVGLLILARRVVRQTSRVALAADSAWLSIAALAILWPTVVDPVLHIGADRVTVSTILLQGVVRQHWSARLAPSFCGQRRAPVGACSKLVSGLSHSEPRAPSSIGAGWETASKPEAESTFSCWSLSSPWSGRRCELRRLQPR